MIDDKFTLDACEVEVWMEKDTEPQPLKRLSAKEQRELITPLIKEYQIAATPFIDLLEAA